MDLNSAAIGAVVVTVLWVIGVAWFDSIKSKREHADTAIRMEAQVLIEYCRSTTSGGKLPVPAWNPHDLGSECWSDTYTWKTRNGKIEVVISQVRVPSECRLRVTSQVYEVQDDLPKERQRRPWFCPDRYVLQEVLEPLLDPPPDEQPAESEPAA